MDMPDFVSSMSTDVSTSSNIISIIEQILKKGDDKRTDSISIFEVLRMYQINQNNQELSQTIMEQNACAVQSTNSIFKVNISATCVYVYVGNKHITSDFKLVAFCKDNEIYAKSTYDDVMRVCEANKNELFRRIFVQISDCPNWMQDQLTRRRKEQIKQKRREILKKIFPFVK